MDFKKDHIRLLQDDWTEVGRLMRSSLRSDIGLLGEANDRILSHCGKMLRPAMSLLVSRACAGTVTDGGHKVAAAAELLHNATLLHDDVADGSEERRDSRRSPPSWATGRRSCWATTGWSRRWS